MSSSSSQSNTDSSSRTTVTNNNTTSSNSGSVTSGTTTGGGGGDDNKVPEPPPTLDGYLYLEDEDVKVPLESTLVNIGVGVNKALPNTVADRLARPSMLAGLKASKMVLKTLKVSKIGWPMRYFTVITKNNRSIVKYYDVDKNVEIGSIEISSIVSIQKIESHKKKIQHVFQIITPQRRYVLAAATEGELEHWYNGFRTLMEQADSQRPSLGAARISSNNSRGTISNTGPSNSNSSSNVSANLSHTDDDTTSSSNTQSNHASGGNSNTSNTLSTSASASASSIASSSSSSSSPASAPPPSLPTITSNAVRSVVDDPTLLKVIAVALGVAAVAILLRLILSQL